MYKNWLFNEANVSYLTKKVFVISFSKTKNIKKREFFCQNLKSQKIVLFNNLVIRELNFVINANILGIAKRPHMEDYEFSKFQQKFCKFKSKFKHYKKKVPICFLKVHNLSRDIDNCLGVCRGISTLGWRYLLVCVTRTEGQKLCLYQIYK